LYSGGVKTNACPKCGDPGFGSLTGCFGGCNCGEMTREKKKQLIEKRRGDKEDICKKKRKDHFCTTGVCINCGVNNLKDYYTKEECDQRIFDVVNAADKAWNK